MPTPPLASDPPRDAEGTPIQLRCRVEQITVDTEHGALPSRLHWHGQVIGWGTHLLYVLFERDNQTIALGPHHLRVLTAPNGC